MLDSSGFWGGSDFVYYCLVDRPRTLAFKHAIEKAVRKGDVVADLGSGSGIFARFAAEAGARKVYAVEADENVYMPLKHSIEESSLSDVIEPIFGDASKYEFPESLDVIICEMVSTGLIDEFQVPAMNHALHFAKEDVRVIPESIDNYIELVSINDVFYGHKLPIVQYEYGEYVKEQDWKSHSLSEKVMYADVDFRSENDPQIISTQQIHITGNGVVNAIRISNNSTFPDGSTLGATLAYCMPLMLPIPKLTVIKGENYTVKLEYRMCEGLGKFQYQLNKA